jgi:hypothetical protein
MYPRVFRLAVAMSVATATAALSVSVASAAQSPESVATITDRMAQQLAGPLATDADKAGLFSAATDTVALSESGTTPRLGNALRKANNAVLAAKGLPATSAPMLRLRLANPQTRPALAHGATPLITTEPSDDTTTPVTAYDRTGGTVRLDPVRVPTRPVFVVEVDTSSALAMGLDVIQSTLTARGLNRAVPRATAGTGYWATKVTAVRLNDDEEPWIKGAAEIFGISTGFGLDGQVKVDTVQMPYLDYDGTTYYPNQLIAGFNAYKYNLADFVMMEDDGDTNYRDLALALASALLTIVDAGSYIPLVDAILNAMPDSWWTDDPDYVDSWYTLSTHTNGHFTGARANGWMDLTPYWVQPL